MSYAIICDARKGHELGIDTLALVDRAKSKRTWWTSDSSNLIMKFIKKSAAEYSIRKLRRNNARVVSYEYAVKYIDYQESELMYREAEAEAGFDYLCECGSKD